MPPDPTGPQGGEAGAGPVLGLLSRGLEFWVRQQCQAIEQLEIQLEGSAWQLMRGRLAGVIVQARGVRYQELEFAEVHLRGEAMAVRMGKLLRQQVLELETPFRVQGTICFSGEGLNRSLAHPNWNWLADQLAEDLLGIQPLASLNLQDDRVVLQACSAGPKGEVVQRAARLEAREGSVAVVGVEGEWSSRVPMDPGIRIETARVGKGRLELSGEATLVP